MTYPYPIIRVPGSKALETLSELRTAGTGVPVILGSNETFERLVEAMEMNQDESVEALIASAREIDIHEWLRERAAAEPDYYEMEASEWPEDPPPPTTSLIAHCDILTEQPYDEVVITTIPAEESWMVPCYLRIGGWNECPRAEEHAALFKHWYQQHGATVACITDDIIELTVERPADTREEALALARQQFVYCADIVDQGVGSLEALAATLLGGTVWYFWWD